MCGASGCSRQSSWQAFTGCRVVIAKPKIAVYQDALRQAEDWFGPDDPELSCVLNNLAVLYKYAGEFDRAEPLYRRALGIIELVYGPEHPEAATIYHNLGGLEHSRGRYAEGEPYARRSVEIREKALGSDNPAVAADTRRAGSVA